MLAECIATICAASIPSTSSCGAMPFNASNAATRTLDLLRKSVRFGLAPV